MWWKISAHRLVPPTLLPRKLWRPKVERVVSLCWFDSFIYEKTKSIPHYCPQTKAFIGLKINDRLYSWERINFTPIFKSDPVVTNFFVSEESMVRRFKWCTFLQCFSCLSFILLSSVFVSMSQQEAAPWTAHETSLLATQHTSRSHPPEGRASCHHYMC